MNNVIEVEKIDASKDLERANVIVKDFEEIASSIVIKNQAGYETTISNIRTLDNFRKGLEAKRVSITKPLDEAKRAVMDLFRPVVTRCDELSTILRGKANGFAEKMRLEQLEMQRKFDEEADQKRKEAEDKAAKMRADGRKKMAEKYEAKAEAVIAPIAPQKLQQPKGIAQVTYWHAKIVNPELVPREWMLVNESALEKHAKNTQGKIPVPGVEFWSETKGTIRGVA